MQFWKDAALPVLIAAATIARTAAPSGEPSKDPTALTPTPAVPARAEAPADDRVADRAGAATVAEKVRAQLATGEVQWQGEPVPVTATFGVAACSDGDIDACLRAADAALYDGKDAGRDRVTSAPAASSSTATNQQC